MKTQVFFRIAAVLLTGALILLVANSDRTVAQDQHRPAIEKKVPEYRRSIEDYRKAMLRKTKVKNTPELVDYAHRNGLV